jgi:DinB family protein
MEDALKEIVERNRSSLERMRAIGTSLSGAELDRTIDEPWTAAALFAHIAFWDRFVLERWRLAAETGDRTPMQVDDGVMDRINDASLRQWLVIPARAAVEECLAAAADFEDLTARLDDSTVSEVLTEGRERLVDRSLHRAEHLRTIEEAFPSA